MTTIKLFLRESKKNSKGESPVSFRIIKNRKSIVISTGIWLLPAQWDKDNLRVVKRLFKFHFEIRLTINRIIDSWIKAAPDSGNLS